MITLLSVSSRHKYFLKIYPVDANFIYNATIVT